MRFLLSTPTYNNEQSNTTKVRAYLQTGIADIFTQHNDLMGLISNNILEVETNFENKSEKFIFILQQAVFVVSKKGLPPEDEKEKRKEETTIYVYANDVREVNSSLSIDDLTKEYDAKESELLNELQIPKVEGESDAIKRARTERLRKLKADKLYLEEVLRIIKKLKK
jgi:hypothetical protein